MNKVIYKYKFTLEHHDAIRAPSGKVVLVDGQGEMLPTIWIEHWEPTPDIPLPMSDYLIRATGQPFRDDRFVEHVGSCVCANGALVWHVYKRTNRHGSEPVT